MMQLRVTTLACLLAFVGYGCAASTGIPEAPLTEAGWIPLTDVEGRMDHMAADPATGRLFVAGLENHSVEVIDLKAQKRIHTIPGLLEPQGLAFIAEYKRLIVASRGDGTCRSFDSDTFVEGPWVDLGKNADNVRYVPAWGTVLVGSGAEPGPGMLSAIDAKALVPADKGGKAGQPRSGADLRLDWPRQADVEAQAELPAHPESFQINAQDGSILVNVPDKQLIQILGRSHNRLGPYPSKAVPEWPVTEAEKNFAMAINADATCAFIVCRKPACLLIYDAEYGKLLSKTPCVGDVDDIFYDADLHRLYVIGGEGAIDVFALVPNERTVTRIAQVATAPKARTGFFIPEMRLLAVAVPHTPASPAGIRLFRVNPGTPVQ